MSIWLHIGDESIHVSGQACGMISDANCGLGIGIIIGSTGHESLPYLAKAYVRQNRIISLEYGKNDEGEYVAEVSQHLILICDLIIAAIENLQSRWTTQGFIDSPRLVDDRLPDRLPETGVQDVDWRKFD